MDVVLEVYWEKAKAGVIAGSIITCREVDARYVWDGTEYLLPSPVGNPSITVIFVTAVPSTDIIAVQNCLEAVPLGQNSVRDWSVKEDTITAAEQADVLEDKCVTVTWTRLKEIVAGATGASLTDAGLTVVSRANSP